MQKLFADMASSGVLVPSAMERYDAQVDKALQLLVSQLPVGKAVQARELCMQAAVAAQQRLSSIAAGGRLHVVGAPVGVGHAGEQLLAEIGAEDPEHPSRRSQQPLCLQHSLCALVGQDKLDVLVAQFTGDGRSSDVRRLQELRHDTVSSAWLWAVDRRAPAALEPDAFVAAIRLRLGAGFALQPLPCRACRGTLDTGGCHALCCAPGESTRGHNDVRDCLFDLARLADATAEREVLGLLDAAPGLRPADVLTSAASPGLTSALDVSIASPDAVHAGEDCVETARVRKRAAYSRHLDALLAEGIEYRPLVWSCWGREHPETTAVLTQLARQAARRKGAADFVPLLRRARACIGAAIARRAAGMLRACMPTQLIEG